MMRGAGVVVLAVLLAGPAAAQPVRITTRLVAELEAGAMVGHNVRTETLPVVRGRLALRPQLRSDRWRLRFPLQLAHRQTFGGSLSELRGQGAAVARWRRRGGLRVQIDARLRGVLRPGWPDLYQPDLDDTLLPTSRHSYWGARGRLKLAGSPTRHHHLRLTAGVRYRDYRTDPAYDPARPTHLAPRDHTAATLEGHWARLKRRWRLGAGLVLESRAYRFAFARDAGSGLTHAAPGGEPANPRQLLLLIAPSVLVQWKARRGGLRLRAQYTHRVHIDTYEGYYTYTAPAPALSLRWRATRAFTLRAGLAAELRRYGPGSYAEGVNHPPLESGSRRMSTRIAATLEARVRIAPHTRLTLTARWAHRRTNFPDYVPGVFPASRRYEIDWDYDTYWLVAGIRWR